MIVMKEINSLFKTNFSPSAYTNGLVTLSAPVDSNYYKSISDHLHYHINEITSKSFVSSLKINAAENTRG